MALFGLFKSKEEKAVKQIKKLRAKIKSIERFGEGAVYLKQDELKTLNQKIKEIKQMYPKDKNVQQAKLRAPKDKKFMGHTSV